MKLLLLLILLLVLSGCGDDEEEAKKKKCSSLLMAMLKQTETALYYAANYKRAVDNEENGEADCRMTVHYLEEFVHTSGRAIEECEGVKSEEFIDKIREEKEETVSTVAGDKGKCK